ncbi:SLATT domain-containing protein [Cellulosimicrobium cellulans]|uniref:SLATT domain-containing protein n=1 Tax=Cellulosimicrobium cellulans TaxID=1710 RepID=UPI001EDBF6DF|nr:SLATT domain-containing protein [Cellulosimicrobium cellulans]
MYTHKTHEKDRERLARHGVVSKWGNIGLCALTFGGVLTALGTNERLVLIVSAVLATLSAGYALFQLSFDPARSAEAHRAAAKSLLMLRNRYIDLLADIASGDLSMDEIRRRRDELETDTSSVYKLAPDTSPSAYAAAQDALKVKEDMTFSDDELNKFLPGALHYPSPGASPGTPPGP